MDVTVALGQLDHLAARGPARRRAAVEWTAEYAGGRWRTSPGGSASGTAGTPPVSMISPSGSPVVETAPKRATAT